MKKFRLFVLGLVIITISVYLLKYCQPEPEEIIHPGKEITMENLVGLWQPNPSIMTLGGATKFEFYGDGKLFAFYDSNKSAIGWKIEEGKLILFRENERLVYEVVQFSKHKVWLKLKDSTSVLIREQ